MPIYLNAVLMLLATITAFVVLAKLANQVRTGRLPSGWQRRSRVRESVEEGLVRLEQACAIDSKRRLVSVRCGGERVVILTGGPADLIISRRPVGPAQGGAA